MTMSHTVTMTGLIEWLLADPKVGYVSVESPIIVLLSGLPVLEEAGQQDGPQLLCRVH